MMPDGSMRRIAALSARYRSPAGPYAVAMTSNSEAAVAGPSSPGSVVEPEPVPAIVEGTPDALTRRM